MININQILNKSEYLLNKENVNEDEFTEYKKLTDSVLVGIIKNDKYEKVHKVAIRTLKPYSERLIFDFIIFRWIRKMILFKISFDNKLPFLTGKSKTDSFKRQIYKIKHNMEIINLKLRNSA